jgi:type IV pilus assembly protein PilQ
VNKPTVCSKVHTGKLRLLALAMSTALVSGGALAATLDDVVHTTLPGNQQQITFKLSESVGTPTSFAIEEPARIAIDLLGTTNALERRIVPVGVGNIESVNIVEAADRTRVVLNLGAMTDYETQIDGNQLLVTLSDSDAADTLSEALIEEGGPIDPETFDTTEVQQQAGTIANDATVDQGGIVEVPADLPLGFDPDRPDRNPNQPEVEIDTIEPTSEPTQQIDVETGAPVEEYIDDAPASTLPDATLAPPADVSATPPPQPRMENVAYNPADRGVDYSTRSAIFTPPPSIGPTPVYTGEELSLNFQDIEVRSVLQLLADFTDLNIVVSDSVSGKLTLRLKNVPWDQALDIILRTKGLDKRASGNVVMVAPTGEIAAQEAAEREAAQKAIELEPLRTEFVQVNYAKATDVAAILKSETGGVLSERGNVTIDDRTNTILVNDTSDVLGKVRALVTRLDIPVRQVLIESRIVIATDDFNREMGVRFGVNRDTTNNDGEGVILSGNTTGITNLGNNDELGDERFNVNLPASSRAGSLGLAFAKLPFGTLLELELSAMQAEGRGEVISSPRVITANQREAYIEQGVEIPYREATSSGAASISFRKAVLALKVKPQITPDERIIMDLTVNKDTVGEVVGSDTNFVPSIDTREVNTQVLVANGETVVLGGIYEQSIIQQRDAVPFFGDLPLVGKLFQYNSSEDDKTELLVFVTPKIVNDGTSALDN